MVIKGRIKCFITDVRKIFSSKKANNRKSKTKIGEVGMVFDGRHVVGLIMSLVITITCVYSTVMKYRSIFMKI